MASTVNRNLKPWGVQSRVKVELNSTASSAVAGRMSASNRQVIYIVLIFAFPKLLLSGGCFQTPNITDFL